MKGKGKRMGRPPKGKISRTRFLQLRVTDAELKLLKRLAKQEGLPVAELLMRPFRKGD